MTALVEQASAATESMQGLAQKLSHGVSAFRLGTDDQQEQLQWASESAIPFPHEQMRALPAR